MTAHIPVELIRSLSKMDHFDPDAFLSVHKSGDQPVSVHMNPGKQILQDGRWPAGYSETDFEISGRVLWADDAYYLSTRPSFTRDPLFHAGAYYVQEASGMFLAFALKQTTDLTQKLNILDLCAAPGGKSTLIQSLISPESLLLSNEVIKTRVPVLCQNMSKWGHANGMVSSNDPSQFNQLPGLFDILIMDAPCSGSGLFRKDPGAASNWSPDLVRLCGQRQQRILADAWNCLKEDGFLIYSTCSYSKEENEDILDTLFQQFACTSIPLNPDPAWNIIETVSDRAGVHGYRFYPDKVLGEGFYLSVIQKKQAISSEISRARTKRVNKVHRITTGIPKLPEQITGSGVKEGSLAFIPIGDTIHALPPGLLSDFEMLKNTLYLKKAGIRVGKEAENDWIPDHELALANNLKLNIPYIELSYPEALRYLRGESLDPLPGEKGWRTVGFLGKRLGWVKLLERRVNNYYPKSWRIRQ